VQKRQICFCQLFYLLGTKVQVYSSLAYGHTMDEEFVKKNDAKEQKRLWTRSTREESAAVRVPRE